MHIKYLQAIGQIETHLDDVFENFNDPKYGPLRNETWGITEADREAIQEEYEAIRYLIGCQLTMVDGTNAKKPTVAVMNRCLERHLAYLAKVHRCDADNVKTHRSNNIQQQYKACRHYLFKFSCPAWVERLPNEILTYANKYPTSPLDEKELPIQTN